MKIKDASSANNQSFYKIPNQTSLMSFKKTKSFFSSFIIFLIQKK
jgi:hypothetical protein